jgi:hypothetical protein
LRITLKSSIERRCISKQNANKWNVKRWTYKDILFFVIDAGNVLTNF